MTVDVQVAQCLRVIYPGPIFSFVECDTQYVGKLSRYFEEVLGDFGPHQTIQLFKFLSPFPPFNHAGDGFSYHHLWRRFRHLFSAAASDFLVVTLHRGDKNMSNGTIPLLEGLLEVTACII